MEEDEEYADLILRIITSPGLNEMNFIFMIQGIGGSDDPKDFGDAKEGVRRLRKVFSKDPQRLEGVLEVLRMYGITF